MAECRKCQHTCTADDPCVCCRYTGQGSGIHVADGTVPGPAGPGTIKCVYCDGEGCYRCFPLTTKPGLQIDSRPRLNRTVAPIQQCLGCGVWTDVVFHNCVKQVLMRYGP